MEIEKIIIEALKHFNQNKVLFIKIYLPSVLTLIAMVVGWYAFDIEVKINQKPLNFGYLALIIISALICLALFIKSTVHIHRAFILNEGSTIKALFKITKRDLYFFKKVILISLIMLFVTFIVNSSLNRHLNEIEGVFLTQVFVLIKALIIAYLGSRLALVLPAAALEHKLSFKKAWEISGDYSAKIFLGVGVLPIMTNLILSNLPSYTSLFYMFVVLLITIVITIIEIGILSLLYKDITDNNQY